MTSFTGATESNAFMFRRGFADRDLILSRNGRNPPPHPRLTPSASPTTKPPGGSGTGPEQALERRHPDPPRATARKLSRPQRSLRAQDRSRGAPTHDSPQAPAQRSNHPAAAGPGRSEHRNVDFLIPVARQRESSAGPNVPCERRTDPAEPPPTTHPKRQPNDRTTRRQRDRAGASIGTSTP